MGSVHEAEFVSNFQTDPFLNASIAQPDNVPLLPDETKYPSFSIIFLISFRPPASSHAPKSATPRERVTLEHITERMAFHISNKAFNSFNEIKEASVSSGQPIPPQRLFVALIHLANQQNVFGSVLIDGKDQIELLTEQNDITWNLHKKK